MAVIEAAVGSQPLNLFFLPFLSPGHMIPLLDVAGLLSQRDDVSITIITTPGNEPFVQPVVTRSAVLSKHPIKLLLISFPSDVHHLLPSGKENISLVPFSSFSNIFTAAVSLNQPLRKLLELHRPDCLVFDIVFHWAADIAQDLSIPSIAFFYHGIFSLCVERLLDIHAPHQTSDAFVVEGLPHQVELTRSKIPEIFFVPGLRESRRESEKKTFGIIVNSFYDLEPEYGDLLRKQAPDHRAWFVGPVSIYNRSDVDKLTRGMYPSDLVSESRSSDDEEWLEWVESKPKGSVLYVCFGSLLDLSAMQHDEIAAALEGLGQFFIWTVHRSGAWQPPKLNMGMVISMWAPQLLILNHPAIGGFMTHCGWNSVLEAVAAGVPIIAWPLMHEQFINERLVVQLLKIGVKVEREGGNVLVERLEGKEEAVVGREGIRRAVERVMGDGEEAREMRKRVEEYKEMAKKAVDEGGSSYEDLSHLIEELKLTMDKNATEKKELELECESSTEMAPEKNVIGTIALVSLES